MISSITGENIDIVRIAIDIFIKLKLMENLENGALFMNEIQNMVGAESKWAEIKRKQREEKKQIQGNKNNMCMKVIRVSSLKIMGKTI